MRFKNPLFSNRAMSDMIPVLPGAQALLAHGLADGTDTLVKPFAIVPFADSPARSSAQSRPSDYHSSAFRPADAEDLPPAPTLPPSIGAGGRDFQNRHDSDGKGTNDLTGGAGNDRPYGGAEDDAFRFGAGDGHGWTDDFGTQEQASLDLSDLGMAINVSVSQDGQDVVLHLGDEWSITWADANRDEARNTLTVV